MSHNKLLNTLSLLHGQLESMAEEVEQAMWEYDDGHPRGLDEAKEITIDTANRCKETLDAFVTSLKEKKWKDIKD